MARTKQQPFKNISRRAPTRILSGAFKKCYPALGGVKMPMRYRPGAVALMQIRQYQRSTKLLIKVRPFQRLVRELSQDFKSDVRLQAKALLALQEALEAFVVELFDHYLRSISSCWARVFLGPVSWSHWELRARRLETLQRLLYAQVVSRIKADWAFDITCREILKGHG